MAWQPTPIFLSGESNGQRRLATLFSPQGHMWTESWTQLKRLSTSLRHDLYTKVGNFLTFYFEITIDAHAVLGNNMKKSNYHLDSVTQNLHSAKP